MLSLPVNSNLGYSSIIYTERGGDFKIDSFGLPPGTFTEVVGLGLAFAAFLAGILTMGTMM